MITLDRHVDLSQRNTFRLRSTCDFFVIINEKDDVEKLFSKNFNFNETKFFVLGGGSNLILPEHFDGLVIHPDFKELRVEVLSDNTKRLVAGAGIDWQQLIDFSLDNECFGLENLSLIPGKVGAAPIQNIGAYGVEVAQFIEHVEVFDFKEWVFKTITALECDFHYRSSIFKTWPERYLIISVSFVLSSVEKLNCSYKAIKDYFSLHHIDESELSAKDLSEIIKNIRRERLPDPEVNPNVGSFFKNPVLKKSDFEDIKNKMAGDHLLASLLDTMPVYPQEDGSVKLSAAWLLEQCSFKGFCFNSLCMSSKHALVMENCGDATQKSVLNFCSLIQEKVREKFSVNLEMEPVIK